MGALLKQLKNTELPACGKDYLESQREFYRRPGIHGHVRWPKVATFLYDDGSSKDILFTRCEPEAPTSGTPEATCVGSERSERP